MLGLTLSPNSIVGDATRKLTGEQVMNKLWKKLWGTWWMPVRCGFPYPEGYATFNKRKNIVLDTGLSKTEAQRLCDELNGVKHD